jgi:hypothetical protein
MQKVNMRPAEETQGKQDRHMGIGKWRIAHLACEYREGGRKKQVTCAVSNVAAENEESENKIVGVNLTFGDKKADDPQKDRRCLLEG